jgi:hypothetical protein
MSLAGGALQLFTPTTVELVYYDASDVSPNSSFAEPVTPFGLQN